MFKKFLVIGLVLLMAASVSMANKLVPIQANGEPLAPKQARSLVGPVLQTQGTAVDPIAFQQMQGTQSQITGTYGARQAPGDTMATVIEIPAPVDVYSVDISFRSIDPPGLPYNALLADFALQDDYPHGWSPLMKAVEPRSIFTNMHASVNGTVAESRTYADPITAIAQADLPSSQPVRFGDASLNVWYPIVGYVRTDDGSGDNGWACRNDYAARSHMWLRSTMAAHGGGAGWGGYYDNPGPGEFPEVYVILWVTFPFGQPPILSDYSTLSNTYDTQKSGTMTCHIEDDVAWSANHSATFNWQVVDAEGTEGTVHTVTPDGPDAGMNFSAELDLSQETTLTIGPGAEVLYWWSATDDLNLSNSTPVASFILLDPPTSDQHILYLYTYSSDQEAIPIDNYFWQTHPEYESGYFWYDLDINKGMDASLFNFDWWIVFMDTWGSRQVPVGDWSTWAGKDFIDNGGNFVYFDQDYETAFDGAAHDYAAGTGPYDIFGISSITSDPNDGTNPVVDTVLYGTGDDPISGAWADNPFVFEPSNSVEEIAYSDGGVAANWADYVSANANGIEMFTGDQTFENYGIYYERSSGGKSIYISYLLDLATALDTTDGNWYWVNYGAAYWDYCYNLTADGTALLDAIFAETYGTSAPEKNLAGRPDGYKLSQAYPNPFNPTTQITFAVPTAGKVALKVYNINGQEVASLFNGNMAAGTKTLTFDASKLASGVYLYRMEAGDFAQTRKMVLVK